MAKDARNARRMAPKKAVTAAVYSDEEPLAYGVVLNLSESGACLVTDTPLPTGRGLHLKVSFFEQGEILEPEAQVVWTCDGGRVERSLEGAHLHGVQFGRLTDLQKEKLTRLLDTDHFQLIVGPSSASASTDEFDDLVQELNQDLDRLTQKIQKKVGDVD